MYEQNQRRTLPIGEPSFEALRSKNGVYVDKTDQLLRLIDYKYIFLSRPRRFGKSLMISTLEAMFHGKAELFKGLAAEQWANEQARHPSPVLRFDMSMMTSDSAERLERSLFRRVMSQAEAHGISIPDYATGSVGDVFSELLEDLCKQSGPVAVLIDEYDAPILHNIHKPEQAETIREKLHSFYSILKGSSEYLKFVMLTGISKFSKLSIFSAMNNLNDISMLPKWGTLVGFTQEELEANFEPWLDDFADDQGMTRDEVLYEMKKYYDGFNFDGKHLVYNPWSVVKCLDDMAFREYWYNTSTPSMLVNFLKRFGMDDPNVYDGIICDENFVDAREIERAKPESFLYQSGYLTIKNRDRTELTLGFPNLEVKTALSKTYLEEIYCVERYRTISKQLWQAFSQGNLDEVFAQYNTAILSLTGESLARLKRNETLYQVLFQFLLNASGILALGEVSNAIGRLDLIVFLPKPKHVYVLEFKVARDEDGVAKKLQEAMDQIDRKYYTVQYLDKGLQVTAIGVAIDDKNRRAVFTSEPIL